MQGACPEHPMSAPQQPAPLTPTMQGAQVVFVVKSSCAVPQAVALSRRPLASVAPESPGIGPAPPPPPGSGVPQLASPVFTQSPSSAGRGLLAEQAKTTRPSPAASAGSAQMRLENLTREV